MAGLGRRTHYRKYLTDSVLNDLPEPKDNERIAKVVATRGLNQFDVLLACHEEVDANRKPQLAILPTKFHKLVWVKRNDFVIVETGDNETEEDKGEGGIRNIISHILYKDQIKHLLSKELWPSNDPEFQSDAEEIAVEGPKEEDDGIVYGNDYYDMGDGRDDDLFVNTNRLARLEIQDSSDSESSDEE